jgi:anti-sigma B factor antagonist
MVSSISYTVEEVAPNKAVIHMSGRLDAHSAPPFKEALKAVIGSGRIYLVMDLQEVTFIDSNGLSTFISLFKAVRESNGSMLLAHISPQVKVALSQTHLDRVFSLHPDVPTALDHLA